MAGPGQPAAGLAPGLARGLGIQARGELHLPSVHRSVHRPPLQKDGDADISLRVPRRQLGSPPSRGPWEINLSEV